MTVCDYHDSPQCFFTAATRESLRPPALSLWMLLLSPTCLAPPASNTRYYSPWPVDTALLTVQQCFCVPLACIDPSWLSRPVQRALHRQASILSERHIVVDISNPRFGVPIKDPEALFVPFKGSFEGQMDATLAGRENNETVKTEWADRVQALCLCVESSLMSYCGVTCAVMVLFCVPGLRELATRARQRGPCCLRSVTVEASENGGGVVSHSVHGRPSHGVSE